MFAIFSTREIATAVWIGILILYCLISPNIRESLLKLVRTASSPKLSLPFLVVILYSSCLIFVLTFFPFWKWSYLKDISMWVLFAGIPACYRAIGTKVNEHYFRSMLFENLKFAVLVEFITSTFTFSLVTELLIIPATVFLASLDAIAGTRSDYASVKKLTSLLLALIGLTIVVFSLKEAINSYQRVANIDLLIKFCVPIIFSMLYIPVAYGFAIYSKYELLFVQMSFKEPNDKKVKRNHRIAVLKACKLSLKKISWFKDNFVKNVHISMQPMEFEGLIKQFRDSVGGNR